MYYAIVLVILLFLNGRPVPQHTVWTADWSHDDRYVAVGNSAGELAIFETTHWKKVKSWTTGATTITRVEWNPRHPVLAVAATAFEGKPSIVQLFDMGSNTVIKTLPDSVYGRGVSWAADGETVAYVGNRGKIHLYSREGALKKTLSFTNSGSLFDIDWHPQKNLLLAVEEDIYLIDADRDSVVAQYDDGTQVKGILCCQWHPSGRFFVTGDYGHNETEPSYLKFWTPEGRLLKTISEGKAEYRNARWTRDGRYLVAATDGLLLTNESGETTRKIKTGTENSWGVSWNKGGDKIISGDGAGVIRIIDPSGKVLKKFLF